MSISMALSWGMKHFHFSTGFVASFSASGLQNLSQYQWFCHSKYISSMGTCFVSGKRKYMTQLIYYQTGKQHEDPVFEMTEGNEEELSNSSSEDHIQKVSWLCSFNCWPMRGRLLLFGGNRWLEVSAAWEIKRKRRWGVGLVQPTRERWREAQMDGWQREGRRGKGSGRNGEKRLGLAERMKKRKSEGREGMRRNSLGLGSGFIC